MNFLKVKNQIRNFFVMFCFLILGSGLPQANDHKSEPVDVLIIGATARTATEFIPQALEAGHKVTALARRPQRVNFSHPNLKIVKGDVYDIESLKAAMTGNEVVVSVYGPRVDPMVEIAETDLMSKGTSNIMEAMKSKGNKRLIACTSTAIQRPIPETKPVNQPQTKMWMWNVRGPYLDMRKMEKVVKAEKNLETIILRPAQLLEEPMRNDLVLAVDVPAPNRRLITYADFAAFIISQLDSDQYVGKTVGVVSERKIDWNANVDFEKEMEKMRQRSEEARQDLANEEN